MAYWLLKTEPSAYSFDKLVEEKRTCWDGITNPAALKHLRGAAMGDGVVIYHTGDERRAVGTAKVVRAPYEVQSGGPTSKALPVVDIAAGERLPAPVELATIKADPAFEGSPLVREGRLSFVPLTGAQWKRLMALAKQRR